MNTHLPTLALVLFLAASGASQATEVASWSFGCSNPTLSSSSNAQGRAGYDVKKNEKARTATPDCSAGDVTAPRDVATGQASGKRQHAPVTISK